MTGAARHATASHAHVPICYRYADFEASVNAAKSSCSRVTVSDTQLETIRAKVSRDSVCDWSSYCAARAGDEETNSAAGWAAAECVAEATDSNVGAIIGGAVAGGAVFLCLVVTMLCICCKKKSAPPSGAAKATAPTPAPAPAAMAPAAQAYAAQPTAVAQPMYAAQPTAVAQPMYAAQPVAVAQPMAPANPVPVAAYGQPGGIMMGKPVA